METRLSRGINEGYLYQFIYEKYGVEIREKIREFVETDERFFRRIKRNERHIERYVRRMIRAMSLVMTYGVMYRHPNILDLDERTKEFSSAFSTVYPIMWSAFMRFHEPNVTFLNILGEKLFKRIVYNAGRKVDGREKYRHEIRIERVMVKRLGLNDVGIVERRGSHVRSQMSLRRY